MNEPSSAAGARPGHVRSFVRRTGRITVAQDRALRELWPRFGIEFAPRRLDMDAVFGRRAPRVLEIGFGNGETLVTLAARHSERDFLGIEVHDPGVGHALLGVEEHALTNLRVMRHDAVEVLEHCLDEASLDEALIFFPDPWPKKRHHKRRLIQPSFVRLLTRKLKPTGILRLATDWENYAEHMLEVLNACPDLVNRAGADGFVARPDSRPVTKFEKRGQRLGHGVWDMEYRIERPAKGGRDCP